MHPPLVRQSTLKGLGLALLLCWLEVLGCLLPGGAQAQGVELASLALKRHDGVLTLDFAARLSLPTAVEDALKRGVPVYFVAEATVYRSRWYWRDERVARVSRNWRVAYQPLTSTWRVGLGGLNQTHATLAEALAVLSSSSDWKLADMSQIDNDSRHYVEFSYRLDSSQLPSPMQIGLGGQADWVIGIGRTVKLD
jgi:hypothetical protein